MAIKAIINNTEKEIEQIKNSDEQDIDYVYSRIGDTEVEGESPISIKSIGGELADYRIYGNTANGESVGDLETTGEHAGEYRVPVTVEGKNLFDESKTANILKCYVSVSTLVSSVSTRTIFIECKPSTTYTVSKIRGERFVVGWSDKLPAPRVELQEKVINYNASSITITTGLTAKYLVAYIYNADQDAPITADEMIASVQIEKGSTATPYEPYHTPLTTPIYLPEQIRKVGDEAEYVDYAEQKLHRIGAEDIGVTLPALSTIKGTNTLSVNTSIQPSNMYIKDNFDYKKVFTATRAIEDELPLNYRSIEDNDSTLKNYRIYGQTVDGESVGDRTGNLFDENSPAILTYINNEGNERIGSNGDKFIKNVISVTPNTTYTISWKSVVVGSADNRPYVRIAQYDANGDFISRLLFYSETETVYSPTSAVNAVVWDIRIDSEQSGRGQHFVNFMLNYGSTPLPYEPYGYKVPVTVSNGTDTLTTPIYLPEQIRKVGIEAEYIDYAEQKMYRIGADDIDVTLSALPTLPGTNTLTVGTEVQPSDIYLKGKIKKKPKIYYKIYYYSQDGQTALSTETVEEGHDCTYSTVPTKESDTDFDYTFTGWSTSTNSTTATAGATENIQQNTNLYAAFSKSLKGDTISDSWEEIIANCDNGTYASKYQIGDLKTIDVGTEGPVQMQIVAIDTDLLASDNTKKAPITWISKQLLNTYKAMHSTSSNYLSDWANCDMRTYLRSTILPMLPSVVQNGIKEVTKYTCKRTSSTTWTTVSATENIWLPSYREVSNDTSSCETSGVQYNSIFTDNASRVKSQAGNSAYFWWTRSASGDSSSACSCYFAFVYSGGIADYSGYNCTGSFRAAIGFCT